MTHNVWLAFITAGLLILAAFSVNLNLFYQIHLRFLRKIFGDKSDLMPKDFGENCFSSSLAALFILVGSILIYSGKFVSLGWYLVLITSLLFFLAGIAGLCVASMAYAVAKKFFAK